MPEIGGDAALYFEPNDQDELIHQIESMISNEELREKYKLLGKLRARMFSWENTAKNTYELYKKVLND